MALTTQISKFDYQEINYDALAFLLNKSEIVLNSEYWTQIKSKLVPSLAYYKILFKANIKFISDFY